MSSNDKHRIIFFINPVFHEVLRQTKFGTFLKLKKNKVKSLWCPFITNYYFLQNSNNKRIHNFRQQYAIKIYSDKV